MAFPAFFTQIPTITLRDPLAELLGAAEGGLIEYSFADAVKLAGHSCPTVAAAWLMTVRGLQALYGDAVPERGNIAASFGETQQSGVAGVMASIATLLTGAAGEGGFKGLGGHHVRRELLRFGVGGITGMALLRHDTLAAVECSVKLDHIPADARLRGLLNDIMRGQAGPAEKALFGELWQDRVKRILVDHADDPALVTVRLLQE